MVSWILLSLIGVPLLGGALAGLVRRDRLRDGLVILSSVAIAAGGIAAVALSLTGHSGEVWSLTVPGYWARVGDMLEFLLILVILWIAVRIRNGWVGLFGVLQLLLGIATHLVGGGGESSFELFRIDNLSRIMLLVSCCVGPAILIFSLGYMKHHHSSAPDAGGQGRFYFFLLGFLGFMIGLVVSNQLAFFSFFWEATTLCSYALIGHDGGDARRLNAVRALIINSFGGAALMLGIFLLKFKTGGETFDELLHSGHISILAAVMMCMAAFTKSALFPFQSWLLGAMVAPTPVSAMLHAATMVKAGVYLVMRITPGFTSDSRIMMCVAFAGSLSFLGGALLACTQQNGKRILAYSTISNLGLVVACAGIDSPLAYAAGLSIISFHALSKGLLFLCMGRIEGNIGSRDVEDMDGLMFKMPFTSVVILLGMMSMLLPPFGMLMSKWLAIEATIRSPFLLVFMVLGSALTVFFWAKWIGRVQHSGYHEFLPQEKIDPAMKFSLGIMAVMVLITGLLAMWIFTNVFIPMSETVFPMSHGGQSLHDISRFSATGIFCAVLLGILLHYLIVWRRFKRKWVTLPFVCGENVTQEDIEKNEELKSYDFHSVGGKIEHSHVSSYYFRGIIDEKRMSGFITFTAWLIILVLVGTTIKIIG
ncbi:MAG: Na(+)/H(+) antiporter subunit A [Lentisphaerae bacterium ADurb.Bin242]|nr:MAG: Na(+)/H(+) antiporter subunit A [Lentisphaerae bacterium ADurb.Bin242]